MKVGGTGTVVGGGGPGLIQMFAPSLGTQVLGLSFA